MATIPEITDRLEAATEKAENASQIIYDVANGDASTEVPTASGPTPTLKKWFQDLGSTVEPMLAGIPARLDKAILSYETLEEAQADAATLPDGQEVKAPDVDGRMAEYEVQGGALVFKDFAPDAIRMQSYTDLRAYTGKSAAVDIVHNGIAGRFYCKGLLPGAADDGGTKIIDASGRLWEREYIGRVQAAWFGENFLDAWAVSKKITGTPGVTYTLAATCLSDGEDVDIDAPDSAFIADGSFPAFDLLGGWEHIQTVTAIDSDKYTLADASSFAEDDLVKIVDDGQLWLNPSQAKNGEFTFVKSKTGNELTLVNKPVIAFDTGRNCRIGKLKPLTCRVKIGAAKHTQNALSGNRFLVNVEAFSNQDVWIGGIDYSYPGALKAISCYGGEARIGSIGKGQTINGYGVVMQNCFSVKHGVDSAGPLRHATDGIAQYAFTRHEFSGFGMNAYNEALNSNAVGSKEAAFTTHQGSYKNLIVNCWSRHSRGWVSFRGVGNMSIGGGSVDDITAPIGAFKSTDYTDALTDDNRVINPTIINSNQAVLASQSTSGGILTITGGSAELTSTNQTRLFNIVGAGSGLRLNGGLRVKVKGALATRAIVTDSATIALIDIDDVHFDFSDCVLNSGAETFDIIDNNTNQADLLLTIDRFRITSSQKLRSIYRSPVTLKSGCRLGSITVNAQLHAVQNGKTVADIQSRIDGPIVANFVKVADVTS